LCCQATARSADKVSFKLAVLDWKQNGMMCEDDVLAGGHLQVNKSDVVLWVNQNDCMDGIFQITLENLKPVGRCTISLGDQAFTVNKPFTLRKGEGAVVRCEIHEGAQNTVYKYRILFWFKESRLDQQPMEKRSHELDIGKN
jgi:hypothetical protein